MGLLRVFTITAILLTGAVLFDVIPVNLPHPACHHQVREVALHEQPGALEGVYTPNTALQSAKKYLGGQIHGSESIAISPAGSRIILADKFGWIHTGTVKIEDNEVEIDVDIKASEIKLPGRPLGIHSLSEDVVILCDSVAGLVKVDLLSKNNTVLSNRVQTSGRNKVVYANGLDISENGEIVYFTDSTDIPVDKGPGGFYSTLRTYILNTMEGRATGRLLSYHFPTNKTQELMKGLWYANGVAVSQDGDFVAVVETNGFRVHRYWLKGPKTGKRDLLISNLPGFPDGISTSPDGNFWIALVNPPSPLWKYLSHKLTRILYAWISEYVQIPIQKWGYVIKVSPDGQVLKILADKEGGFISSVSSAVEHQGFLFLGNLVGDYISVFNLDLLKSQSSQEDTTLTTDAKIHDEKEL